MLAYAILLDVLAHLVGAAKFELVSRWVSGDPMWGKRKRTDGDFWHRAKTVTIRRWWMPRWSKLAGWERAALRIGGSHLAVLWLYGHTYHPRATWLLTWIALAVAVAVGATQSWAALLERQISRTVTKPLDEALRVLIGIDANLRAKDWISVDHDIATNPDAQVVFRAPRGFAPDERQQKDISNKIAAKLGGDFSAVFRCAGNKPTITAQRTQQPPARVPYGVAKEHLLNRPKGHFLLGYAAQWLPIYWNWADPATAHLLISLATGGGKSMYLADIIAQALHDGWLIYIIDGKHSSQKWAKNLAGVHYARTDVEIEAAFEHLKHTVRSRHQAVDNDQATGQEILIVIEEMNATKRWLQLAHRSRGGRDTSPAVNAIQELAFTARAAGVHLATVAQLATANSMGGSDVRENYTTRLANSRPAFRILAPEIQDPPNGITSAGYAYLIKDAEYWALRGIHWADEQLRRYATTGIPQPQTADSNPPEPPDRPGENIEAAPRASVPAGDLDGDAGIALSRPHLTLVPTPKELASFRQHWERRRGVSMPANYNAAVGWRIRDTDRGFGPVWTEQRGRSYLYTDAQIEDWLARRKAYQPARDPISGRYLSRGEGPPRPMKRVVIAEKDYGPEHVALKRRLEDELVDGDPCPLCFQPMYRADIGMLDLAHDETDATHTVYLGLAHATCNRREGALIGAARRKDLTNRFPDEA